MTDCEAQFDMMSQKLVSQELRIQSRALEELRKDYDGCKEREQRLLETSKLNQQNLEDLTDQKNRIAAENELLKEELETLRKEKEGVQKQLQTVRRQSSDPTARNNLEAEIIKYRTKCAGLEGRLAQRQKEFDMIEERLQEEISELQERLRAALRKSKNSAVSVKENKENCSTSAPGDYKVGFLTATNDSLREEIARLKSQHVEMEAEVKTSKDEIESLRSLNKALEDRVQESEGSNDVMSKYWTDEQNKLKSQKADLRWELIKLRKEHDKLLASIENEKNQAKEAEVAHDIEKCEADAAALKALNTEIQRKCSDAERKIAELENAESEKIQQLTADLLKATNTMNTMKEALATLDSQSEQLLERLKREVSSKKAARQKVAEREKEITELKAITVDKKALEEEISSLKVENLRLMDKVLYLETEVSVTHSEYREELAKLANRMVAKPEPPAASENRREIADLERKVAELESTLRQKESVVRSMSRSVEQSKAEVHSAEAALSDMRDKQCKIVNENTELRKGVSEAIATIKSHNEKIQTLTSANEEHQKEIDRLMTKLANTNEELEEVREMLRQKEDNVAYLQSIVQPRKLEKLRVTSSQSTLVTGPEDDYSDFDSLMQKRNELARQLSERRKDLEKKKQEEVVPLLKAGSSYSGSLSGDKSPTSSRSRIGVGTMRHDIPHHFSKNYFVMSQRTCEACFEVIPRFTASLRCKDCTLTIHQHCKASVLNTCGLPSAWARFYVDNHVATPGTMAGWVKIWRSNETPNNKWMNAYAQLEGNTLSFYETDVALAQCDAPIMTVDLSTEHWRIYNQTGTVRGIAADNVECLIEIKLQKMVLYMLASTPDAKFAWIQALQSATDRRILERSGSHRRVMHMETIVRMGKPFLKFQCTEVLNDWLLIGTPQGLFVTNYSNRRMPFQIAGFSNVFQLKIVKEFNLLFAIDGTDRNVVVLHIHQLEAALNMSQFPQVKPTQYNNIAAAHLIEVSEPHHCHERYIYIATAEGISIFHHLTKKDAFVPLCEIPLDNPAMCIVSCPNGFVFGADTYFFVKAGSWTPQSFRADWAPDVPISVVKISDDEILLVNHNCGVFTTPQGVRTRSGIVEWDRVPVSVTYLDSYLFIVYTDMISVARVPKLEEVTENSPIIEELDGYRAPGARVTGIGKQPYDVLVTVMNETCVELHCFTPSKNSLKRKTTSVASMPSKRRP
uniref:Phorbol-ester/DAG-type domain-containing protein n=1 Tax=Panagrellus redivivus TaxID=6233 RepID=A0A7E4VMV7_PANRE